MLLDEYQDTRHAQLTLLRALFGGGHPVTAVGDPCQSIYGWRGASAASLRRFAQHFRTAAGEPAPVLPLSTSFRNDELVLDVANDLSAELRGDVPLLTAAESNGPGVVRAALLPTVLDEAAWLADQLAEVWHDGEPGRTVAVLCRRRAQFDLVARALRARGLPVEVVGLGGLLDTPEVRDVVSTLQVLADPTAGAALVRLLTGARWRIGARDLAALCRRARALAARGRGDQAGVADAVADASLVEALDDLGPPEAYSAEGYPRLAALGAELAALRRRTASRCPTWSPTSSARCGSTSRSPPPRAGSRRPAGPTWTARRGGRGFAEEAEGATLGAFLAYLAAAEDEERGLEPGGSRWTPTRCRCSPCTRPRAWSGTWSRWPA